MLGRSTKGLAMFALAPLLPATFAGWSIGGLAGAVAGVAVGLATGVILWLEWSAPLQLRQRVPRHDRYA